MELSKNSTILEVLQGNPQAADILGRFGMGYIGCAIGRGETIEQAAAAHGIPLTDLLSALGIKE